ncbi:Activating signal cointegrator 1 complex subunit 1 [Cordyceps javanica]|uniref:Activating signal cointegrator 1 complex subunit 1 n=1 Tax=Cordyceps javanica TaxID=43265 RepID=A0A545W050_9HYPO|nr:Activating signal cointegrator 1 complex subunit 1 [Cordyceps javanica]TQW07324.1 Activating signal cointegrator 1 complex subunit 1 [Cordyceps javanica]
MAARQGRVNNNGPTHFLCIPLLRRQLARNVVAFRADVTNINAAPPLPLPSSAVRPPGTMHITLGVMSLPQPAQLARAVALLRGLCPRTVLAETRAALRRRRGAGRGLACSPRVASQKNEKNEEEEEDDDGSVWLTLKGLHAMQDPSSTGVLYAPPLDANGDNGPGHGRGQQDAGLLFAFCQAVRQRFMDAGLMEPDRRPFLLHATVVNTTHVKSHERGLGQGSGPGAGPGAATAGRGRGGRERMMLDARTLLEEYAEHVWLDRHEVRSLAICRMGAKPKGDRGDEAYEVVEEVAV